jgi:hypothetical protein
MPSSDTVDDSNWEHFGAIRELNEVLTKLDTVESTRILKQSELHLADGQLTPNGANMVYLDPIGRRMTWQHI